MPKYYIQDGVEQTILDADNALQACFFGIKYRFEGIPVNGFYVVSEKGFENHEDDMVFSSDEVISGLFILSLICWELEIIPVPAVEKPISPPIHPVVNT